MSRLFASRLRRILPALLPLALIAVAAADESDPSSRVARLAYLAGQVSIAPAGVDEWAVADLNRPVTSGDKLWADADARVELSIGSATMRLGEATGFSFLSLDDHTAQMQLSAGTLAVHVRNMDANDVLEVDTPNVAVTLLGPGDYRVEANDAGDASVVKVSGGSAAVSAGGREFSVHPQQQMIFTGTTAVAATTAALAAPDAFDSWGLERDRRIEAAQLAQYVSPEVIGSEDLAQNGTWEATADDGYVWAPTSVAVGWAPYHYGHWVWISPWGWTWVDAASWGFAPFHYGRWASIGGRWCWVPGPAHRHPVYAPALVAWLGGPPTRGAAASGGGPVAWFPLGPREVYVPAYPTSASYVRNINLANTAASGANIISVYNGAAGPIRYRNRSAAGAITAVSQAVFTNAAPVGANAIQLRANEFAAATTSATPPAITPGRQSLLGTGATAAVAHPPPALQNRRVVARTSPPAAPVPFAAQQQAIHANGGRPIAPAEMRALEVYSPAARIRMTSPAAGANASANQAAGAGEIARPQAGAARAPGQPTSAMSSQEWTHPERVMQPATRTDRPPAALGQPGSEARGYPSGMPSRPVGAGAPAVQDLSGRVDRPRVEFVPAPTRTSGSVPAAPAPQAAVQPAVETKTKPAAHADRPAHPAVRNTN